MIQQVQFPYESTIPSSLNMESLAELLGSRSADAPSWTKRHTSSGRRHEESQGRDQAFPDTNLLNVFLIRYKLERRGIDETSFGVAKRFRRARGVLGKPLMPRATRGARTDRKVDRGTDNLILDSHNSIEYKTGWTRLASGVGPRNPSKSGWIRVRFRGRVLRRLRYMEVKNRTLTVTKATSYPYRCLLEVPMESCAVSQIGECDIEIQVQSKVLTIFCGSPEVCRQWYVTMRRAALDAVEDYYTQGRKIGSGTYGVVFEATSVDTGKTVAIKTVDRSRVHSSKEMEFIRREINVARQLSHRSIVQVHDVFDRDEKVHFVMELLSGGDLFDAIAEETHFTEKIAASVIRDILEALAYMHDLNIVHRDLKPENILCGSRKWPYQVKIADFGTAWYLDECDPAPSRSVMSTFVGTPYYMAPEVLGGKKYGFPVDLWACGVMLFAMIAGKLPWSVVSEQDYCKESTRSAVQFPDGEWAGVSEEAKSLIRGLLQIDPGIRLTAHEACEHRWLQPEQASVQRIRTDRSFLSIRSRKSLVPQKSVNLALKEETLHRLAGMDGDFDDNKEWVEIKSPSESEKRGDEATKQRNETNEGIDRTAKSSGSEASSAPQGDLQTQSVELGKEELGGTDSMSRITSSSGSAERLGVGETRNPLDPESHPSSGPKDLDSWLDPHALTPSQLRQRGSERNVPLDYKGSLTVSCSSGPQDCDSWLDVHALTPSQLHERDYDLNPTKKTLDIPVRHEENDGSLTISSQTPQVTPMTSSASSTLIDARGVAKEGAEGSATTRDLGIESSDGLRGALQGSKGSKISSSTIAHESRARGGGSMPGSGPSPTLDKAVQSQPERPSSHAGPLPKSEARLGETTLSVPGSLANGSTPPSKSNWDSDVAAMNPAPHREIFFLGSLESPPPPDAGAAWSIRLDPSLDLVADMRPYDRRSKRGSAGMPDSGELSPSWKDTVSVSGGVAIDHGTLQVVDLPAAPSNVPDNPTAWLSLDRTISGKSQRKVKRPEARGHSQRSETRTATGIPDGSTVFYECN